MMNFKRNVIIGFLLAILFACNEDKKLLPVSELYISMPEDGYEVKVNDTIDISPKITYDYNSNYTWKLDGEIIGENRIFRLIPKTLKYYKLEFEFTNDRGADDTIVYVQSMYNADFEEYKLDKDTFWLNENLDVSLVHDEIEFEISGSFKSKPWRGITYSNLTGSNKITENKKYSCYKKPSASAFESKIFGVLLLDESGKPTVLKTKDGENHLFKSMYVNNSYYVYESINKGINGSKKFGGDTGTQKDYLKLIVTGFAKDGTKTGSVEMMLADFTSGSNRYNEILTEWEKLSLEKLGKVSKLEFTMSSSDTESGKIKTPPFVCIDEVKIIE